jgi:hypothetical protein
VYSAAKYKQPLIPCKKFYADGIPYVVCSECEKNYHQDILADDFPPNVSPLCEQCLLDWALNSVSASVDNA